MDGGLWKTSNFNKSRSFSQRHPTLKKKNQPKYYLPTKFAAVAPGILALAWCIWLCFYFFGSSDFPSSPEPPKSPSSPEPPKSLSSNPRYVTIVLPSIITPPKRRKRLETIAETWGPAARAIYVTTSETEYDVKSGNATDPPDSYPHTILLPESIPVEEGLTRLYHVLQIIAEKYNPDFAFFVNDHTYVLPHNACTFLQDRKPEDHLYAGHALRNNKGIFFNSGASGYFLSRVTLNDLLLRLDVGEEHCAMFSTSKWLQMNPGISTAECLGQSMNVYPADTRDHKGTHIFHPYGLVRTITGDVDDWFIERHKGLNEIFGEDPDNETQPRSSKECCSSDTVSFHYVETDENLALTRVLKLINMTEDTSQLSDDKIMSYMRNIWPKGRAVGGYSRELPSTEMTETWDSILSVVRSIAHGVVDTPCVA